MNRELRNAIFAAVLMLLAVILGSVLRPDEFLYKISPIGNLAEEFPAQFGEWKEDVTQIPLLPVPSVQEAINEIYSQLVARTYVHPSGARVMLSVAYGDYQGDAKRLHLPEGCYGGQGFSVIKATDDNVSLGNSQIPVKRFVAKAGNRVEAVTYWVMIGDSFAQNDWGIKKAQLQYSLSGVIPDGLLIRVSIIHGDEQQAYDMLDHFIEGMVRNLRGELQQRMSRALGA